MRKKEKWKMKKDSRLLAVTLIVFVLFLWILPSTSYADDWYEEEEGYFTLYDESGNQLTTMGGEMYKDDEYISGDNKHYSISKVDKDGKKAYGKFLGEIELPQIEELTDISMETAAQENPKGKILLYCTHSDESYVPSDGKASIPDGGGIYDVAESLKSALEKKGISAILDKTSHHPHDAGAYRRSRQTAIDLIRKNMPVAAVFDIHRDAIPVHEYTTQVNGEDMSKVRMVVGKRNQNREANEGLAYKIKAVADKVYPGLIKDIYIGSGMYNQELSPRSLLFEFGTHETSKEAAQKSSAYMADVIARSIHGGTMEAKNKSGTTEKQFKVTPISQEQTQKGGKGIFWVLAIVVIGGIAFLFISSGSREMFSKVSKFTRQDLSSFMGRKKKK